MKQLTSYNRVAGYLNKLFDLLNQRFFERREDVPKTAISIGIGTIMNAEKILLVACGEKKAKAVKSVVEGRVTPHVPGSILQFHPHVTVIADRAATALLKK